MPTNIGPPLARSTFYLTNFMSLSHCTTFSQKPEKTSRRFSTDVRMTFTVPFLVNQHQNMQRNPIFDGFIEFVRNGRS